MTTEQIAIAAQRLALKHGDAPWDWIKKICHDYEILEKDESISSISSDHYILHRMSMGEIQIFIPLFL